MFLVLAILVYTRDMCVGGVGWAGVCVSLSTLLKEMTCVITSDNLVKLAPYGWTILVGHMLGLCNDTRA